MLKINPERSCVEEITLNFAKKLRRWTAPGQHETREDKPAMTVICISDTHDNTFPIPTGDLLLHAGDLTSDGTFDQLQEQLDWINQQPHEHKVIVSGNHDLILNEDLQLLSEPEKTKKDLVWGSITYLENTAAELHFASRRTLKVFGSPNTPKWGNLGSFAFQYARLKDGGFWDTRIPLDTDIVLTRGPPRYHLDSNANSNGIGGNVGCDSLLEELYCVQPDLVVCGHVHGGAGQDLLPYDRVQHGWEGLLRTRLSLRSLMRMLWESIFSSFGKNVKGTKLVNAAIKTDDRCQALRSAVVVSL